MIKKIVSQTKDTSTGTTSTYEYKQLEQQNARLRETLVKLRDLSAHEKHEFQKLQKDLDQKKSEISELGRTKEKLSATVEEMEHQIADLQEQVNTTFFKAIFSFNFDRILDQKIEFGIFVFRLMQPWEQKRWLSLSVRRK